MSIFIRSSNPKLVNDLRRSALDMVTGFGEFCESEAVAPQNSKKPPPNAIKDVRNDFLNMSKLLTELRAKR